MNNPESPKSLRTPENQALMDEWAGKENRPKWVDELAFKVLEEYIYEDSQLIIGGKDEKDPTLVAYSLLRQE
mgnify:CR=1 FL=1